MLACMLACVLARFLASLSRLTLSIRRWRDQFIYFRDDYVWGYTVLNKVKVWGSCWTSCPLLWIHHNALIRDNPPAATSEFLRSLIILYLSLQYIFLRPLSTQVFINLTVILNWRAKDFDSPFFHSSNFVINAFCAFCYTF